jgi:hypothetical protein
MLKLRLAPPRCSAALAVLEEHAANAARRRFCANWPHLGWLLEVVDVTLSTFRDQSCLACQDMQRRLDAVVLDLENAETALRAERRKVKGLQKQLAAQHLSSPLLSDARALFEFWQAQCHHPRSVFDAQRQRLAVQRLAEHGADRLRDAIRGASIGAYVDDRGVRHDGFELILRDAGHVDKFVKRWEAHDRARSQPRRLVEAMRERFGEPIHDRGLDVFLTGCLACGAGDGLYRPFSFRLTDKLVGSCGACGATVEDLHA